MLVLHCAGHDRTRAWAVASALLLSAVGTCAIAAEDLVRGRFERWEVLIPVFAAVCVVIALRVLGSAPRQKLEFRYGASFESNDRSATFFLAQDPRSETPQTVKSSRRFVDQFTREEPRTEDTW